MTAKVRLYSYSHRGFLVDDTYMSIPIKSNARLHLTTYYKYEYGINSYPVILTSPSSSPSLFIIRSRHHLYDAISAIVSQSGGDGLFHKETSLLVTTTPVQWLHMGESFYCLVCGLFSYLDV